MAKALCRANHRCVAFAMRDSEKHTTIKGIAMRFLGFAMRLGSTTKILFPVVFLEKVVVVCTDP
jgi:hypothetical protein